MFHSTLTRLNINQLHTFLFEGCNAVASKGTSPAEIDCFKYLTIDFVVQYCATMQ